MEMPWFSQETIAGRQDQWDAFHRWQSVNPPVEFSLEERIDWYVRAARLSTTFFAERTSAEVQRKVGEIQQRRQRLQLLKGADRHG